MSSARENTQPTKIEAQVEASAFLRELSSYNPTIPEEIINHYLRLGGVHATDPNIKRLMALAADKFISEILYDAKQYQKLQEGEKTLGETLRMEDLEKSLSNYGIKVPNVKP